MELNLFLICAFFLYRQILDINTFVAKKIMWSSKLSSEELLKLLPMMRFRQNVKTFIYCMHLLISQRLTGSLNRAQ